MPLLNSERKHFWKYFLSETKLPPFEAAKAIWRADNNHVEQFLAEPVYQNAGDRIAREIVAPTTTA